MKEPQTLRIPGIRAAIQGPRGPNVDTETYAFVTTTPNLLVATIITSACWQRLREEEFASWLTGFGDEAALDREYPAEQMRVVQEGLNRDLLKVA